MPLFKIGGTVSNVNVVINKIKEINIIIKDTLKELFKKRANYFYLPFFS